MKKATQLALVAEGRLSRSELARVPGLREQIAFVKGRSLRVAARLANNLNSGTAVECYEALEDCGLFIVYVPPARADATLAEMASSELDWRGRMVVLWSRDRTSADMTKLESRGALRASIAQADSRRFVVEGDRAVVRELRSRLPASSIRWLQIPTEAKPLFFAGVSIAQRVQPKVIRAALECFRSAGVSAADADELVEALFEATLRSALKGGRSLLAESDAGGREKEVLSRRHPALARLLYDKL